MSADLEQPSSASGEETSQSRFTAVNGRSPPSWPHASGQPHDAAATQQPNGQNVYSGASVSGDSPFLDSDRRGSDHSNKRKRTDSEQSTTSSNSSAKRRQSPNHVNGEQTLPHLSNGIQKPTALAERPTPNGHIPNQHSNGEHSWPSRSHDDEKGSEARLIEAFHGESQGGPPPQSTPKYHSPPPKYPPGAMQQHPIPSQMQSAQAGMPAPMLQKQRKRNFANRTKTGCLTCRERKKKCDEGKPTCNNCERGGFPCKGYSQTNSTLKSNVVRDHHPIQAKNGVFDPVTPGSFPPRHMAPPHMVPPPAHGPPPPHPPPPGMYQAPPPPHEHDPRTRLTPRESPRDHPRALAESGVVSYSRPPWVDAHGPTFNPDNMRTEYPYLNAMTDQSREQKRLPLPPTVTLPQGSAGPHPTTMLSPYNHATQTAKLGLEHLSNQRGISHLHTEKAKMLNHEDFNHNDQELQIERRRCNQRVCEFNNKLTTAPDHYTDAGKTELLRKIIKPESDPTQISDFKDVYTGHLGDRVEVQAPFYCDYGYNIRIGDDAEIGRNCDIGDACTVRIGARCMIGPDVKFCTQDGVHHHTRAPGTKRLAVAKPITVGDDVFIGAGSIILGGANVEAGCVVGAGTIVRGLAKGGNIVVNENSMRFPKGQWGKG